MSDRAAGNALFSKGQYEEAVLIYKKLTTDAAALSNSSEASLQLGKWSDAESFAKQALELDPSNVKSRSRLGRALASQGKSVVAHLNLALIKDESERASAHQRLLECEDQPTLFLGPVIVSSLEDDQFGLFATCDMQPGELVLREKRICPFGRADVIQDEERAKEVLAFIDSPAGHKLEDAADGIFPRGRGAVSAMNQRVVELSVGTERSQSDVWAAAHLFSVLFLSSFEVGLFSIGSLFNHSCAPNCNLELIDAEQGVIEWRANRKVLKGEELFFSYLPMESLCLPVQVRRTVFAKNWGGAGCECARCSREGREGQDKDVTGKVCLWSLGLVFLSLSNF
jgi:hypothetical protein